MSRLTRGVVIASAALAAAVGAMLATRTNTPVWLWTLGAAVVAGSLSIWAPATVPPIVASAACVAPIAFRLLTGGSHFSDLTPWLAALLASIGVVTLRRSSRPTFLDAPLALWALVIALSWPIVALREADFSWEVMWDIKVATAAGGFPPPIVVLWITHVALSHLVGLLWLDFLMTLYADAPTTNFVRRVIAPFAVTVFAACLLSVYQGYIDLRFLSASLWPYVQRAAGGLIDANASGMLTAMWIPAFIAIAAGAGGKLWRAGAAVGATVAAVATWCSGSRSALLAASTGTAVALLGAIAAGRRAPKLALVALATISAVALMLGLGTEMLRSQTMSPMQRLRMSVPATWTEFGWSLWTRDGYGTAAVEMIREFPAVGIGIGAFHSRVGDYSRTIAGAGVPPDNAQSWYRHQLSETGILGSLGWLLMLVLLVWTALKRARPESAVAATALKGSLAGLAVASLIGVPGQHPAIVVTFWTFAFWMMRLLDVTPRSGAARVDRTAVLAIAATVALAHAAGTYREARHDLRVPNRAKRFDFDYAYGVAPRPVAGANQVWTSRHAVVVPKAPEKWLKLSVWVEHPDADRHPVDARVWIDGERVVRHRMPRNVRATRYIRVPGDGKRFVLEARVDRTFRPEACAEEECERGLEMQWEFVRAPPR